MSKINHSNKLVLTQLMYTPLYAILIHYLITQITQSIANNLFITYCFSVSTTVMQTPLNVTLHVRRPFVND